MSDVSEIRPGVLIMGHPFIGRAILVGGSVVAFLLLGNHFLPAVFDKAFISNFVSVAVGAILGIPIALEVGRALREGRKRKLSANVSWTKRLREVMRS